MRLRLCVLFFLEVSQPVFNHAQSLSQRSKLVIVGNDLDFLGLIDALNQLLLLLPSELSLNLSQRVHLPIDHLQGTPIEGRAHRSGFIAV